MKLPSAVSVAAPIALALLAFAAQARPGERDQLNACKEMVARAEQTTAANARPAPNAGLQKCRQIIKEWTLRDSRMSIDENGQPVK
jgi:uncharacterized protein (DUF1800 family)